tara:strand:+ start:193 stop:1269 length:1077 start_codon:yes stop_codon:yes gene_type:complete
MGKQTILYKNYNEYAKIIDFHGWDLPIQFSSILGEVNSVRSDVGMFDVSHMGRIMCEGETVIDFLNYLLTGEFNKLSINQASYMFLCDSNCGIIDDLVAYKISDYKIMIVCNAGNKDDVVNILKNHRSSNLKYGSLIINDFTNNSGMIAVQGPNSPMILNKLFETKFENIKRFNFTSILKDNHEVLISRTGYTGEVGYEIITNLELSSSIWDKLINLNVTPCGLGSRDVLRIEAGLSLHGNDITSDINPYEAELSRFVNNDKQSVYSRSWNNIINTATKKMLIGFIINGRGIPRSNNSIIYNGESIGYVTSGTFSPTLGTPIGLGFINKNIGQGSSIQVDIRGKKIAAIITKIPFLRR